MAPKFGNSGVRGLVTDLTPDLVADHIRALLHACPVGMGLFGGATCGHLCPIWRRW